MLQIAIQNSNYFIDKNLSQVLSLAKIHAVETQTITYLRNRKVFTKMVTFEIGRYLNFEQVLRIQGPRGDLQNTPISKHTKIL